MAQILVIDDQSEITVAMREILEAAGYEVLSALDVTAGMVLFDASAIDLVITDILMPDRGGAKVIRQVQSRLHNTKLVVMSGYSRKWITERLQAEELFGIDAILEKPFSAEGLLDLVNKVLAG